MDKERSGETMKLGAFFHPTGNHVAAWLHPDAQIDAGTNFRHYAEITQTAERGKFDLMFVADAVATRDRVVRILLASRARARGDGVGLWQGSRRFSRQMSSARTWKS
jgi:alkanesulfonate monooxygenase SsuD/methylene tetrahydromethanopterin reductase-like flavin-dependent oxidoreductase (luciferase family)